MPLDAVVLACHRKDGKLVGTPMIYSDYKFSTGDGKAHFKPAAWPEPPEPVAKQKSKYRFWINNGRTNHIWQTAYHDRYIDFRRRRFPMSPLETNPDDTQSLRITASERLIRSSCPRPPQRWSRASCNV